MSGECLLRVMTRYDLFGDEYLVLFYLADNHPPYGRGVINLKSAQWESHIKNPNIISIINRLIRKNEIINLGLDESSGKFEYRINGVPENYPPRVLSPLETRRKEFNRKRPNLFKQLIKRDGYICRKCPAKDDLSVDHIIPIEKGGSDDLDNLQILCRSCNAKKGVN
jgi:hypothetical protein